MYTLPIMRIVKSVEQRRKMRPARLLDTPRRSTQYCTIWTWISNTYRIQQSEQPWLNEFPTTYPEIFVNRNLGSNENKYLFRASDLQGPFHCRKEITNARHTRTTDQTTRQIRRIHS